MHQLNTTSFTAQPAPSKPPRWKPSALTVACSATAIVVGPWIGLCTHLALHWLTAGF
jgi:hypothetical protein